MNAIATTVFDCLIAGTTVMPWIITWPTWPVLFAEAQRAEAILAKPAGGGASSRAA